MKRLIQIVLVAVLVIGFSTSTFAQTTGSINANASVTASLTVTGDQALTFGSITQGETETINADGSTGTGEDGDETEGQFSVSGTSGSVVSLQYTSMPSNLTDSNSNTMGITWNSVYADAAGNQGSGTTWSDPANTTVTPTLDSTDGKLLVWVGGSITAGSNQAGGTYDATVTLEATYN